MALVQPARGATILHTHVNQYANLLGGVENAGEDIRLTQQTNASDYANVFGNVDTTNGYAAKFQYGPAAGPTTLMTVSKATGVAITQNSDSVYALDVQQLHANDLIQRWRDSAGNTPFIMTDTGLFSSSDAISGPGLALGNGITGSRINILTTFDSDGATAIGGNDCKPIHNILDIQISAGDSAATSTWATQSTGSTSLKALEAQAVRAGGSLNTTWGFELGSHSLYTSASATADTNVGLVVHSDNRRFCAGVGAVNQDVGVLITGADPRYDYIRARAADYPAWAGAIKFRVAGGVSASDQDGDVVTAARVRAGDGTVSLPAFTFDGDLDTGMYRNGADGLAFATAGTQRVFLSASGSVVTGGAILTNATDGFLYIAACGGAPSGTPTTLSGVPMVADTTNGRLYLYYGAAWHYAALT